jgi:hypothetical protein
MLGREPFASSEHGWGWVNSRAGLKLRKREMSLLCTLCLSPGEKIKISCLNGVSKERVLKVKVVPMLK